MIGFIVNRYSDSDIRQKAIEMVASIIGNNYFGNLVLMAGNK